MVALDLGGFMKVEGAKIEREDPMPLQHMQQARKGLSRPAPEQQQTHGFDKSIASWLVVVVAQPS